MTNSAYTKDGVDVELGDDFSAYAAGICRSTWKRSRFADIKDFAPKNFRGPRGLRFKNLPAGYYLDFPSDGVGTKVGIITEAGLHRHAGHDLVAMGASDITRWGGVPLAVSNVLDVSTLGAPGSPTYKAMAQLVLGLGEACSEQGIVLMRGETAELGPFVGSENPDALTKFNWAGCVVGAYHPRRVLTGRSIKPGDRVVALRENGFRSNGLSTVRKALKLRFGDNWWDHPQGRAVATRAGQPSVLYDRFLAKINGWYSPHFEPRVPVKSIVHISGGGMPSKFGKDILFPLGLSAMLDNLWLPPHIMAECAEWRRLEEGVPFADEDVYRTWNGGQGMLVVMHPREVGRFVNFAKADGVEAKEAGEIFRPGKGESPSLQIVSGFTGNLLTFD